MLKAILEDMLRGMLEYMLKAMLEDMLKAILEYMLKAMLEEAYPWGKRVNLSFNLDYKSDCFSTATVQRFGEGLTTSPICLC